MPTQDDYLTQIDADLIAHTEPDEVLNERRELVAAAADDDAARIAYRDHVQATQAAVRAAEDAPAQASSEGAS